MGEEFEAIDDCRLNRIEQNKITENLSLPSDHPAKNNKKNEGKMASKVGEPGEGMIKKG